MSAPTISVNRDDVVTLLRKVPRVTALPADENGWRLMVGGICHKAAAEIERLRAALESIRQYGSDTLSGRADGPDDRAWQRGAVLEMTNRASRATRS
jgi:hypothetical protein